ncbi:MAG: hypothetical protein JJU11_18650 [Candidatus Sumerlaeia bacterium]|nr:hypothetical protein [Candidatus Sumerlaeia bacterium]
MTKLRRFNEDGLDYFSNYLDELRDYPSLSPPPDLLESGHFAELVGEGISLDREDFETRFDLAEYLYNQLDPIGEQILEHDTHMWSWIAFRYFEHIRIPKSNPKTPGARARYIPEPGNYLRNYRHMIAGPYYVYRCHADVPERARVLLCTNLNTAGDFYEQVASRQEMMTNPAFLDVASQLYLDPDTGRLKPGAGGKGQGSARRLAAICNQFDLTFDLYGMTGESILSLLPGEFGKYR